MRFKKKRMYLYKDRKTGELLLSEVAFDDPNFIFVGNIEVDE